MKRGSLTLSINSEHPLPYLRWEVVLPSYSHSSGQDFPGGLCGASGSLNSGPLTSISTECLIGALTLNSIGL